MKEHFEETNFTPERIALIMDIDGIVKDYQAQGYRLSVRQIFYQLVSAAKLPNSQKAYKLVIDACAKGRLAGLIDWDAIEDRNRGTIIKPTWETAKDIVTLAIRDFAINRWADQDAYVEVMVEKAALEGILIPVCDKYGVPFSSNKGYSSLSTMYASAKRIQERYAIGKKAIHVIYAGDFDPSGLSMVQDVKRRLELLSLSPITVHHVGLNREQIDQYNPPPNPVKKKDSRADKFIAEHGTSSWELDALEPSVLASIFEEKIKEFIQPLSWEMSKHKEEEQRELLQDILEGVTEEGED